MLSYRLNQAKSYLSVATFLIVALLASETHAKKHHSKTSKKTTEIISGSVGGAGVVGGAGGAALLNKKKPEKSVDDWGDPVGDDNPLSANTPSKEYTVAVSDNDDTNGHDSMERLSTLDPLVKDTQKTPKATSIFNDFRRVENAGGEFL